MGSRVVTPDDVLQLLMNDGTVDSIRMKVLSQLKANEQMKRDTMIMVEQSRVLNTSGAEKQSKRDLFDALRKELETPVLEKASKAVWELIISSDGLGKEITDTVDRAYCRLTGLEAPPAPAVPAPTNQEEGNGNGNGERNENSRKRSFDEDESGDGEEEEEEEEEEEKVVIGNGTNGNGNGNGKRRLQLGSDSSEESGTPIEENNHNST